MVSTVKKTSRIERKKGSFPQCTAVSHSTIFHNRFSFVKAFSNLPVHISVHIKGWHPCTFGRDVQIVGFIRYAGTTDHFSPFWINKLSTVISSSSSFILTYCFRDNWECGDDRTWPAEYILYRKKRYNERYKNLEADPITRNEHKYF